MVAAARNLRQQPVTGGLPWRQIGSDLFRSPSMAWGELTAHFRESRYRNYGIYEAEKTLLLYFRDRELAFRQASAGASWSAIRLIAGATNAAPSSQRSGILIAMIPTGMGSGFQREGSGLLGRMAEAEARRRLVVTAIALERYRVRHGAFPQSLAQLVPQFLEQPPIDFMDGKALRYSRTSDGHFVLYSVGLDCVDQGGDMRSKYQAVPPFMMQQEADLVWPRPASDAETEAERMAVHIARKRAEAARQEWEPQVSPEQRAFNPRYGPVQAPLDP